MEYLLETGASNSLYEFFFVISGPAEAINCYECDGSQDKVCNDPFGKNATTKSGCVQCSKWKGSYSGIEGTCINLT